MASKNRDAIFEIVELKDNKEENQDVLHRQHQSQNHGGTAIPTHTAEMQVLPHRFQIVKEGTQACTEDGNHRESLLEEERKIGLLQVNRVSGEDLVTDTAFDNAIYNASSQEGKSQGIGSSFPCEKSRLVVLLFVAVSTVIILFVGLIASLGLASLNNTELSRLQQTAVDNASYQATLNNFHEMFNNMRAQMSSLNDTVVKLSLRLEQISEQLNVTSSALNINIDSIQSDLVNQRNTLMETDNRLSSRIDSNVQNLSSLQINQLEFDVMLNALETNVSNLSMSVGSEIQTLRATISSRVNVFESCQDRSLRSENVSFTSNDSQITYTVHTGFVNMVSSNRTVQHCTKTLRLQLPFPQASVYHA